jgi:hypothetical protein
MIKNTLYVLGKILKKGKLIRKLIGNNDSNGSQNYGLISEWSANLLVNN